MSLEHELLDSFKQKQWTLAFAESCTGGDLAARLTKVPEASKVFLGGIIAYSEQIKKGLLAVTPDKIVSEQMAQEMVKGLSGLVDATVCVSVTGWAGPAGPEVGNIWIAYQKKGEPPKAENLHLQGERSQIIQQIGDHIFTYLKNLV